MSDPALEAARRAAAGWFDHAYADFSKTDLIDAAREMAAPIRELHKPVEGKNYRYCAECYPYGSIDNTEWPCDTARLVYAEEELT